jgi:hypothetical protein
MLAAKDRRKRTMKANKILLPTAMLAVLLVAGSATAQDTDGKEFLFNGYAVYEPAPDEVEATMDVYGMLSTVFSVPTPIMLDTDNYEYTIHVDNMVVATVVDFPPPPFARRSLTYTGGTLTIYADAIAGGTAADYAAPGTFVDGEAILIASVDDGFVLNLMDTSVTPPGVYTGSGTGTCDFFAGTQLDALTAAEYYWDDWYMHALDVSDDNPPSTPVPAGFDRSMKIKLVTPNDPTAAEESTWGRIKELYR